MPPKAKKKGSGGGRKKKGIGPTAARSTDGDAAAAATAAEDEARTRAELIERAVHLQNQCTVEEARATEFRERTKKIQGVWNIEKQHLEAQKEVLQAKQTQLLSIQSDHRTELDGKRDGIKRILSSQDDEVARAKTKTQSQLKILQEEHMVQQNKLLGERNEHNSKVREMESSHGEYLKRLQDEHSSHISELREDHQHRSANIASRAERELRREKEEVERKRVQEVAKVERTIEDRVAETLKRHEVEMADCHRPYNDALYQNLDLIKSLKDEVLRLKKEQRKRDRELEKAASTNRNTVVPLEQASRDVKALVDRRDLYKQQQADLKEHKQSLCEAEAELSDLKFRYEVLFQKFEAEKRDQGQTCIARANVPATSSVNQLPINQTEEKDQTLSLSAVGHSALTART